MTTTQTEMVHAHALLKQLSDNPMTLQALTAWVHEQYGEQARFRTCSREGFSLSEIIEFFQARQKIVETDGVWQTNLERVCKH